jgi:hypothetical protein
MTRRLALLAAAAALAACTEQAATVPAVPRRAELAHLVLSDSGASAGATVDVFAHATAASPVAVGSFTMRIRYDTTYLRLESELPLDDGAMRASNASAGSVRIAGVSQAGFAGGRLAALRFTVLRANAAQALQLVVDEMHTVERAEVKP